jgi:hydrogenase 3 maturation protease
MLHLEDILRDPGRLLFVGVGNVLRRDDGVGVYISRNIRKRKKIHVLTAEVSLENYLGKIRSMDPDRLVIIDCMEMGAPPGTYRLLQVDQVEDLTFVTHNISLNKLAGFFPCPTHVLGIQPAQVDFGEELSQEVFQAARNLLMTINDQKSIPMSNKYYCPICTSNMNIGSVLVFSAKSPDNEKGLIFLETELGNYSKTTHPEFELREGVEYKFYCPVCHAKLNKADLPNLVRVEMVDEEGKKYEINISNIIGEHCTYQIEEKEVKVFGPHSERYRKYLDVPEEYRKYI